VYLKLAADQAAQRSSTVEAEAQYRDAISIVKEIAPTRERDRLELGAQLGLAALLIGKGWGAQAREEPLIRATELCTRVGERQELLGLLFQSGQFYLERSRCGEARQLAERAIALAQDGADRIHEAGARHNLAEYFVWSGDLLAAKPQCEKALELLATAAPESLISSFGFDLWMLCSALAGLVELLLGRPDHSLETEDRLLERAGSSSHRYSKTFGMFLVSSISTVRRHLGKTLGHARAAYEASEEYGFAEILNWALWSEGYARFWQGEREVGLAQQKRAIQELEALGSRIFSSWRMAWLAEAQVQLERLTRQSPRSSKRPVLCGKSERGGLSLRSTASRRKRF
jgi:hypothetical protein